MGLFSNGFEFVIVIGLVKSSRTPSIYDVFFLCRLIFRGTLSYGLNQQLNQESDINKKRKNTGSRRKGCLVGKLSNSKKQTHTMVSISESVSSNL